MIRSLQRDENDRGLEVGNELTTPFWKPEIIHNAYGEHHYHPCHHHHNRQQAAPMKFGPAMRHLCLNGLDPRTKLL
jgi:hypothetical protein